MQATFLSVAMLVIILHLIIPHDHHRDIMNPDLKHSCPVQENHNGHTSFPEHCSMLNDMSDVLAFEVTFGHLVFECIIPDTTTETIDLPFITSVVSLFKFPDKQVLINSKLLRAPPVII